MRARLAVTLTLVVALAASCGNSKNGDADSSSSTTSAVASSSTTAGSASNLRDAKLDSLVLVQTDFPTGWTASPNDQTKSAEDKQSEDELNACVGTSGDEAEAGSKTGDDFSQGDNFQAGSEVSVVKDDDTYRKDLAALKSSKVTSCIKDAFTKLIREEVPDVTSVDVADLSVPHHGDVTTARRLTVEAKPSGQNVKVFLDVVLMGKRRYELGLTFFGLGSPFESALQRSLIDKVGRRLDAV